jgi:hypothetical protein
MNNQINQKLIDPHGQLSDLLDRGEYIKAAYLILSESKKKASLISASNDTDSINFLLESDNLAKFAEILFNLSDDGIISENHKIINQRHALDKQLKESFTALKNNINEFVKMFSELDLIIENKFVSRMGWKQNSAFLKLKKTLVKENISINDISEINKYIDTCIDYAVALQDPLIKQLIRVKKGRYCNYVDIIQRLKVSNINSLIKGNINKIIKINTNLSSLPSYQQLYNIIYQQECLCGLTVTPAIPGAQMPI